MSTKARVHGSPKVQDKRGKGERERKRERKTMLGPPGALSEKDVRARQFARTCTACGLWAKAVLELRARYDSTGRMRNPTFTSNAS